jgi:hypothetical protein
VVTNHLPNDAPGDHGGDELKATVTFGTCPGDMVAAINDDHVRLDDARTVTEDVPFHSDDPAACLDLTPTDRFSRPEEHGFAAVKQ